MMRAFEFELQGACLLRVGGKKMGDEEQSSILVRENTTTKMFQEDVPVEGVKVVAERLVSLHVRDGGVFGYILKRRKARSLKKGEVEGVAAASAEKKVGKGRIGGETCGVREKLGEKGL
jgi:phage FluMu protein gp41